jgi:hypothetical protein
MDQFSTAAGAYGFAHGNSPVGDIMAETSVGANVDASMPSITGGAPLGFGVNNPLFWLLILFLVFTGWIFGAFDFGVKRVGNVKVGVGKR